MSRKMKPAQAGCMLAVLASIAASLLSGCATTGGLAPQDAGDPCAAQRAELRGAKNYYTQAVVQGVALGAVTGALGGWLTGQSGEAAATGALIGGVAGGIGGYYLAKQRVADDVATLSTSIQSDVLAENAQIDKAALAFAKLKECRLDAVRAVKADYAEGQITRDEGIRRLEALQDQFQGDLAIADAIAVKMTERAREFQYASNELIRDNPEAQVYIAKRAVEVQPVKAKTATAKRKLPPSASTPPPPKKPPPPAVVVADVTETNQIKQKAFTDQVDEAKVEARTEFSLEDTVGWGLRRSACPCG